jgi:hypothetical protein
MSIYFKKLIDLYEEGTVKEYISCFEKWEKEERLSHREIILLKNITPSWLEYVEGTLDFNNREILWIFLNQLQRIKGCDENQLQKEYGISPKDIQDIRHMDGQRQKKVGIKIAHELFQLLRDYDKTNLWK